MSLLLVRHGETALNVARVLQPADTPLSERGLAQAVRLAERLVAMGGVAGVLSSDLPRARQTAEAIAAACGVPLETSERLQERNFGNWRGRPYDAFTHDPLTMDAAPPGGESMAAFQARTDAAFAEAVARHARLAARGAHLVVVSHGLVIRQWVLRSVRLSAGAACPAAIGNTALTIVGPVPPHAVELLACVTHLDGGPADRPEALSGG